MRTLAEIVRPIHCGILALVLISTGCASSDPTEPVVGKYEFAPAALKPYLGAVYDVSIVYHGVRAADGAECELEALPFTAPGETMPFGQEIDMWAHFGVDYDSPNDRTLLVSVNPETGGYSVEPGWFDVNAGSGDFTFSSTWNDASANAEHSYLFAGAFTTPRHPDQISLEGEYTRTDATRQCDVLFTIQGSRIGDLTD